ncbi:MAG: hypothetical protein NC102_01260 [Clostridium sp.]|nr:hypothetical protein [Clostridium sp.]
MKKHLTLMLSALIGIGAISAIASPDAFRSARTGRQSNAPAVAALTSEDAAAAREFRRLPGNDNADGFFRVLPPPHRTI